MVARVVTQERLSEEICVGRLEDNLYGLAKELKGIDNEP
jgi:hypothetical protein